MNIFHKIALQGLLRSRTRTVVTIIGVILSAAMFTAVITFGFSLLDYVTEGAAVRYGNWHAAFLDASPSFAREREEDSQVTDTVTFENIGYAKYEGWSDPERPYLFIAGFGQDAFDALPLTLLSGRLPENSGELLISAKASEELGGSYKVGDTVSLAVGKRVSGEEVLWQGDAFESGTEVLMPEETRTYEVVGVCGTPVFEGDFSPGYTAVTLSGNSGQEKGDVLSLFVTLENPRKVYAYLKESAEGHSYILNEKVLQFMGISENNASKIFTTLLYSVAGIVIAIIMTGSVFLIHNSFSISLNERMRQIGILASVGATGKQLLGSVLFEGMCIGAVGIPIGILLGLAGIRAVISIVAKNFGNVLYDDVSLTLNAPVLSIIGAVAVSLVTILISAYIPARKASRMPVMECIRQTNVVKVDTKAVKTSRMAWRIYGMEGTLALKNFKRNKKRYRSIVLSLVLSVVLFISTSSFVTDLKQTMAPALSFSTYDIGFGTSQMDDEEMLGLYDELKDAEGVTESSVQEVVEYYCKVSAGEFSDGYWKAKDRRPEDDMVELPVEIQFLDENTFKNVVGSAGAPAEEYLQEDVSAGGAIKLPAIAVLESGSDEEKGEKEVEDFEWLFKNSSVEASLSPQAGGEPDTGQEQAVSFDCIKTIAPDIPPTNEVSEYSRQQEYYFEILAPWPLKDRLVPSEDSAEVRVKGMTFSSETPSRSEAAMKTIIQNAGIESSYILLNSSRVFEENRNWIFIANVFAYTFIVMISLVAVANVFNTISTNIRLRRRELAMLRSVGMSDRDFNKMMRFECALYGLRALLFGLPMAVLFSWLIYKGLDAGGGDIVFVMPWASIGISVFSVLFVIFVTMIYAVSKIKKENIIDALRDDMT